MSLRTPVIVGSGLLTDKEPNIRALVDAGAGCVITKTIHPAPPPPVNERVHRMSTGMLNSTTYSQRSVPEWCAILARLSADGVPVIANVHASSDVELARLVEDVTTAGCGALELGISCINEAPLLDTPDRVHALSRAVRDQTDRAFSVKLAVDHDTRSRIDAAIEAGASAITLSDTIPGLAIDRKTGDVALGGVYGYSGHGLKPIVQAEIYRLRNQGVEIPILASGGVYDHLDVIDYLGLGSNAVQVYSALHEKMLPTLSDICAGVQNWFAEQDVSTTDVIGRHLGGDTQ